MDGTASLANREIGRVLPANYRKVPFSGAAKHLNEAATARYFGRVSGESSETGTRWRSEMNSNCRYRFVNIRRRHQVKVCDIETNCKALSRCSAFLVRFRALGATGAKWPALLFESLRDICGRFRSSRTRGRSPSNVADRVSRLCV